jgi:hypothetical protein
MIMPRKKIVLALTMILIFSLSGACWASWEKEKPIGDITNTQQVIDKLFTGRTLNPIEGVWVKDAGTEIAIVNASLVNIQDPDYKDCDYIGIILKGKYAGRIYVTLKKTEYSFVFYSVKDDADSANGRSTWKILSPTLLQYDGKISGMGSFYPTRSFVRTYPTP